MSRDGWAALPHGATGLSAVRDCGISWSYSFTIFVIEIKWYLTFWPLPRGQGQKKINVGRPIYVSNSHTKFGWILSNGLGGDSITYARTDEQMTDGGVNNIPFAFLKKRGDKKSKMLHVK